jgi:hypothetical protein
MSDKEYTAKQVNIYTSAIVIAIAFMETSGAVWTWTFLRQFLWNIFTYGFIAIIAMVLVSNFIDRK